MRTDQLGLGRMVHSVQRPRRSVTRLRVQYGHLLVGAIGTLLIAVCVAPLPANAAVSPSYSLTAEIMVGDAPHGVAYDPVNHDIYVANNSAGVNGQGFDTISVISAASGQVVDTISNLAPGSYTAPEGVAVDTSTNTIYVTDDEVYNPTGNDPYGFVTMIDGTTNQVTGAIALGYNQTFPSGIAYDPANGYIYVAYEYGANAGGLAVISAGTEIGASDSLPNNSGDDAASVAVDPGTGTVYVADDSGNAISVIPPNAIPDSNSPTTFSTMQESSPVGVAVDAATNTLYVTHFTNGPNLDAVSEATGKVTSSVGVGCNPNGVATDPVTGDVLVALDCGPGHPVDWNGIAVFDPSTGSVSSVANQNGPPGAGTAFYGTAAIGVDPGTGTAYASNSYPMAGAYYLAVVAVQPSAQAQTISFANPPPSPALVGGSYSPGALASSGLAVALSIDPSSTAGTCAVDGADPSQVDFMAIGTCEVDASQAGDADYLPAQAQTTVTVQPAPVTAAVSGSQVFGSGNPTFSYTDNAPAGVTVSGTLTCTSADSQPLISLSGGTHTLDGSSCSGLSLSVPTDYTLSYSGVAGGFAVSRATQALTFTSAAPSDPTVGGPGYTPGVSASSGLTPALGIDPSSNGICSISNGGTVIFTGIGDCTLDANQAGDSDYLAAPQVEQVFSVGPSGSASSVTGVSTSSGGVATATDAGTSAVAQGTGSVTVSQYSGNPSGTPSLGATGEYFDVALSTANSFTSVVVSDCNLGSGQDLEWWNGSAWQTVSPASAPSGTPSCVTATLSSSSTPSLAQLSGTVFQVTSDRAPDAPSGLRSTFQPAGSVRLHWQPVPPQPGVPVDGYDIYIAATPGGESPRPVNANAVRGATFDVTGLATGQTYYFTVEAFNGTGHSLASNEVAVNVGSH